MNSILEVRESELDFPLLAMHIKSKMIVFFKTETEGTVLDNADNIERKKGEFISNWISVRDSKVWRILPLGSKITLIQS